jgi:hypothetical protein
VKGEITSRTPTTPTQPNRIHGRPPAQMPFTGVDAWVWLLIGLALITLGSGLVSLNDRRLEA